MRGQGNYRKTWKTLIDVMSPCACFKFNLEIKTKRGVWYGNLNVTWPWMWRRWASRYHCLYFGCLQKTFSSAENVRQLGHPRCLIVFQRIRGYQCKRGTAFPFSQWTHPRVWECRPRAVPAANCGCLRTRASRPHRLSSLHDGGSFQPVIAVGHRWSLGGEAIGSGLPAKSANVNSEGQRSGSGRSDSRGYGRAHTRMHTHTCPSFEHIPYRSSLCGSALLWSSICGGVSDIHRSSVVDFWRVN